jgi:hypothetical protein
MKKKSTELRDMLYFSEGPYLVREKSAKSFGTGLSGT